MSAPLEGSTSTPGSSSQLSAPSSAAPRKGKGGRKGADVRVAEFITLEYSTSSKRSGAQCKHCGEKWEANKAHAKTLLQHIVEHCPDVSEDVREHWAQQAAAGQDTSTAGEEAAAAGVKRKAVGLPQPRQTDIRRSFSCKANKLTSHEFNDVNRAFLRCFVCNNIPFEVVNSPHLKRALEMLRPGFMLPSATTFKEKYLYQEYQGVTLKRNRRIEESENLTLSLDGWTDPNKRSIFAFVLVFPEDREPALLETRDVSAIIHSAENLAGMMMSVITKHKIKDKLALVVTDNASNMLKARQLLVQTEGYVHIVEMRCMMHGFNLVLGSVLSFPWAQRLVVSAQRVVTYFRASHRPLALLREAAVRNNINTGLRSANKTRFTSKHDCIKSVLANQPAFTILLQQNRDAITNADVVDILEDHTFWAELSLLDKVLVPLSKVIMAVQANRSTLADVCRYWMYLAHELGSALNRLPPDFQRHIIWAFSTRAKQQDSVLCRLALYLDPRFRQAASSSASGKTDLIKKAAEYSHAQGWGADKINAMLEQLTKYGNGVRPYDTDLAVGGVGAAFSSKSWWQHVGSNTSAAPLAELAIVLEDMVPHAADPERVFSKLGWYASGKTTRLSTAVAMQKTSIKLHYDAISRPMQRKEEERSVPDTVDLTGPAHIAAAGLSDPSVAAAAEEAAAAQQDSTPEQEPEEDAPTVDELQEALQHQYAADQAEQQDAEQPQVPEECRSSWQAAALWGMGVEGADLLHPAYHEALLSVPRRIISTPAVGVDPAVLAAQFIARQQAEQAAAAAAAAAQAAMGMVPPPGMGMGIGMIPTPGLPPRAQQELQRQSALLAGLQR